MPTKPFPLLPRRLGVAADLTFIVSSPMAFITDALLVYDQLVIAGDTVVLDSLYSGLGAKQLGRLLNAQRLAFCPGMSSHMNGKDEEFTRSKYLAIVEKGLHLFDESERRTALRQIDEHLVVGASPDYRAWQQVAEVAENAFIEAVRRPEYDDLQPIDPQSGCPDLSRQVGLRRGLARMNDLVAAGVRDMEMDGELPVLLDICFPTRVRRPVSEEPDAEALQTIDSLHRIHNLPSPGKTIVQEQWTDERAVDLILSDEASELRAWLHENIAPDLDVRESYIRTLKGLPSKQDWMGWLRFGTVTAVTTTIGALATPVAGAAAGVALGALDHKLGQKVLELADPYHPKEWLSIAERGYGMRTANSGGH